MKRQRATNHRGSTLTVYGYTDYRLYLQDFYRFRKGGQHGYSFRIFSRTAEFSSPNILKLVMEGKRNLTGTSLEQFIVGLGLTGNMAEYFRRLVKFNHAENQQEKEAHYEQLVKLIPHGKKRELGLETVEYLSHWLNPVLRELVQTREFCEDPYWIIRRLTGRATVAEVITSLRFLESHGFIARDEQGKLQNVDHIVESSDEIRSMAIRHYHKIILGQAIEHLENLEIERREYGALTFLLPEESFSELKSKIKGFRQELHRWAISQLGTLSGDANVIQVNFQMYSQSKSARISSTIEEG